MHGAAKAVLGIGLAMAQIAQTLHLYRPSAIVAGMALALLYTFLLAIVSAAVSRDISVCPYRLCHAERCLRPLLPGRVLDGMPATSSMGERDLRSDDSFVPKIAPMPAVEAR